MNHAPRKVLLKPGKEKSLLKQHPWIFSGAIASLPPIEPGEILPVYSASSQFLAQAYFHPTQSLIGRVLSFDEQPIETVLEQQIDRAIALRSSLFNPIETNCYRLIHAEGDGIPGLIVDVYDRVLSLQINTWGIERLRDLILRILQQKFRPIAIYEKSLSLARKEEGLADREGWAWGSCPDERAVRENGIEQIVSFSKGQKTGLFLDHREMRSFIGQLAHGKRVLNCFSYSGGFSLSALKGGAERVVSVDCNASALDLAERQTLANGWDLKRHQIVQADVFDYLRQEPLDFDLVILDPPAFAKTRAHIDAACTGYKEINRLCFQKLPMSALLLTCSCSHMISEELFQNIIFQAALEAGRHAQILSHHRQALDHPTSLMHPEGKYLKSLLLKITGTSSP